jgi:hypothetical protein
MNQYFPTSIKDAILHLSPPTSRGQTMDVTVYNEDKACDVFVVEASQSDSVQELHWVAVNRRAVSE